MQQFFVLFVVVCSLRYYTHANLIYECNFDNATLDNHCFTTTVLVLEGLAFIGDQPPDSPFSDVTSSLKPTANGEVCKLPYKVGSYNWDMYFCYKSVCPTATSGNSTCALGQFAGIQLLDDQIRSFQLKTGPNGINGIDQQYLTYYYYISKVGEKSITVRKEEMDNTNEIIDVVTSSPFNGWIKRQVVFNATNFGYKLYFDMQKISSEFSLIDIGLDEISVQQGRRYDESITESPITTMPSTLIDILTSIPTSTIQTTQIATSVELTTVSSDAKTISSSISSDIDKTTFDTESTMVLTTTTTIVPQTIKSSTIYINSTYVETNPTTENTIDLSTQQSLETSMNITDLTNILTSITVSSKTSTTVTNLISTTSTTTIIGNVEDSSKKLYIIILSTVIPVILIVAIGIVILVKRPLSTKSSAKKSSVLIESKYQESSTDDFELKTVEREHSF